MTRPITETTEATGEAPGTPIVRIESLSKRFGDFPAVEQVSLEVRPGEILALLGPNGAGKTTTIRMLMGILEPTAGGASVKGLDCFTQRAEVMRHVGYLPDEPVFYDYLRGREIVEFVGRMHGLTGRELDGRRREWMGRLELSDAQEEYAVNYSKGMKKKLAILCALLHEPDVLILDEPTNGLDPYATRSMHEIIREQAARGAGVFFSTHLLDQAEKLCDRVGILHRGRVAAVGRLDELRRGARDDADLEQIFFAVTGAAGADETGR